MAAWPTTPSSQPLGEGVLEVGRAGIRAGIAAAHGGGWSALGQCGLWSGCCDSQSVAFETGMWGIACWRTGFPRLLRARQEIHRETRDGSRGRDCIRQGKTNRCTGDHWTRPQQANRPEP